ncbi:alpha/beta hydrolase [Lacunimicrobium album]
MRTLTLHSRSPLGATGYASVFVLLLCATFALPATTQAQQRNPAFDSIYKLGPDSFHQEGVPTGKYEGPFTIKSDVYPGTQHTYWVYLPAQYDPNTPAALMIFNDGHAFKQEDVEKNRGDIRAHNVLDNLIYRREIPVMLAVFINPGRTPEQPEPSSSDWGDRTTNRKGEYDTIDDKYAKVICDELMPELHSKYNISKDPNDHGIGGASSGAIAAFKVAWERPDDFRKVLSLIGSYTNIKGGHVYTDRVLESDKKPIRIYLQDGRNDNRNLKPDGSYDEKWDWFHQNVRLAKALEQKDYDVTYSWGIGNHGQKHGGAIFPDMMRWLWREHPQTTDPRDNKARNFNTP